MRIVMIGATGLVGSLLAEHLLGDGGAVEVHGIVRSPSGRTHPRWTEHVAPSRQWPEIARDIAADKAVSALGTTWRAAGSEAAFRAVDLDLVDGFARAARAAGARHMLIISSVGADPASRAFYLRTKGEMEQSLENLGFDRLDILQPGLLRGKRGGERRRGERIAIALSPLTDLVMRGPLRRYAAIDAGTVARAAATCLYRPGRGVHRLENQALVRLAR